MLNIVKTKKINTESIAGYYYLYYLYIMKIRIAAEIEKAGYKKYNRGEQSRTVGISDGGEIIHIESAFPDAYRSY
jgi:hypothetical protein